MQKTPKDIFHDKEKDLRGQYKSYLLKIPNSAYRPSDYVKKLLQRNATISERRNEEKN